MAMGEAPSATLDEGIAWHGPTGPAASAAALQAAAISFPGGPVASAGGPVSRPALRSLPPGKAAAGQSRAGSAATSCRIARIASAMNRASSSSTRPAKSSIAVKPRLPSQRTIVLSCTATTECR